MKRPPSVRRRGQKLLRVDKVRASRDGHEFHEAWAARQALRLVVPSDELAGIAVEGFAAEDQGRLSSHTVEIADLVFYYGKRPTFPGSRSVVIVQLKYSHAAETHPFRASDAKKTLRKFAAAYRDHKKEHGAESVDKKLSFELVTNRPILDAFSAAIDGLAAGATLKGEERAQANQFKSACDLKGADLTRFARRVRVIGLAGSLSHNKLQLARALADWSIAHDAMSRARLGGMRDMVREKAGVKGQGRNVITRPDVLAALELQGPDDLLPCPESFPEVGPVVDRDQLVAVAAKIPALTKSMLIHADGGAGKTVFVQSLAKTLSDKHETVLFDCFGGGRYRAPGDARHLPQHGLIHIVNKLACDGLCDPLLPSSSGDDDLVKVFRRRLEQAVATLRRASRGRQLLLFLDAADNAGERAKEKAEESFPRLLVESFHHGGPVDGVQLIISCRTHRRELARGEAACEELELKPFSLSETAQYLRGRITDVTDVQVQVGHARSCGNPRILEHLAGNEEGLLDPSKIREVIKLDDLLRERILKALGEARKRGHKEPELRAFLAGLSVLPPPVPLEEYANVHGIDVSAVRSCAADLAPLLERTKHGLTFRDEPTETLVREEYAVDEVTLRSLAESLFKKQATSVYAASTLPDLLQKLDDGQRLYELALDDRFPESITSTVGRQRIRYARLKAAVLHAARTSEFDRLVCLLVELATLAAVNDRGTRFIVENPDLVVAARDIDATRRLAETRTKWPGTRHGRLAIASVLSGDLGEAYRHAISTKEWIYHFYQQKEQVRIDGDGPEIQDVASIALCLLADDRGKAAARFLKGWKHWYAYRVAEHVFDLARQARAMETMSSETVSRFLDAIAGQPVLLAAALSSLDLDDTQRRSLIGKLADAVKRGKKIEVNRDSVRSKSPDLLDGLLKSATTALALGLDSEARTIASAVPGERPGLWSFRDPYLNHNVRSFVTCTALRAAVARESISTRALLPQELVEPSARVAPEATEDAFRQGLKAELEKDQKAQQQLPGQKKPISYETKMAAERFIAGQLGPLRQMAQQLAATLAARAGECDQAFLVLVELWTTLSKKASHYSDARETRFFDLLGRQLILLSLWARADLEPSTVGKYVGQLKLDGVGSAPEFIQLVACLAKRADLHELAGKTARHAWSLIEREDDVAQRSTLCAQLSRAIMPASFQETASYFRSGLEQMDVIGSGDYEFTNELLLLAAATNGAELADAEFHTLSNLCELNMYDTDKFPWVAFSFGLSRTSGLKTLARLGRWDDREKASLDYTLLPYLAALIEDDKIDPAIAVALLQLSDPAEHHGCGTGELAKLIESKRHPNSRSVIAELLQQFLRNHPRGYMAETFAALGEVARRNLGKDAEESVYLTAASPILKALRDQHNDHTNYRGPRDPRVAEEAAARLQAAQRAVEKVLDETEPSDEESMSRAVDDLHQERVYPDARTGLFEKLRAKLRFSDRPKYISIIASLERLDVYSKLHELQECKKHWSDSSSAIVDAFRAIAQPLIRLHADDLVAYGYLSSSKLEEISSLTGIAVNVLTLNLIASLAAANVQPAASIWMGLAGVLCKRSNAGVGQAAVQRLFAGNAAKLAANVPDGPWMEGMYPAGDQAETAAGLIWLRLGAPSAANRWRAAHSVRCLARLDRWDVIDVIVQRFRATDACPFQAPELQFFFLHARLWLLIALARAAIDYPVRVGKYADLLKAVAFDDQAPHVLMRHFAAHALLTCARGKGVTLAATDVKALKAVDQSPFPRAKARKHTRASNRAPAVPGTLPKHDFHLDYDFNKIDVQGLGDVFGRPNSETRAAIAARVRVYDKKLTSMYDLGGRPARDRDREMNNAHHTYGQQLGWHALKLVAGEFLAKYPIVPSPYRHEEPWMEWLGRDLLTRNDGLWLADGTDKTPIDTQVNVYEKGEDGVVITGDQGKLLSLLGIDSAIGENLVVGGDWRCPDDIDVHVGSALVSPAEARALALRLSQEDPLRLWLPRVEEMEGEERWRPAKEGLTPWIVDPGTYERLDVTDPLGAKAAVQRLRFTKGVADVAGLKSKDPFGRTWADRTGRVVAHAEAWAQYRSREEDRTTGGDRLVCCSAFLKEVLAREQAELVMLIILRRYVTSHNSAGKFWHTTALVHIRQSLEFEYFPGKVNELHVSKY